MKRSDSLKEAGIKEAKQLLSLGYSPAAVALRLQRTYGFSRATSFRDVDVAAIELEAENAELDADTKPAELIEQRNAMLRDLEQVWMHTTQTRDIEGIGQLTRSFERLWRMGGIESQKY